MIGNQINLYNAISSTPLTSAEYIINPTEKTVLIDVSGTNTSRNITFAVKFDKKDATTRAFPATNISDPSVLATSTTGNNETWEFTDIEGYYSIVIGVTSLSGGNLTVKATSLV